MGNLEAPSNFMFVTTAFWWLAAEFFYCFVSLGFGSGLSRATPDLAYRGRATLTYEPKLMAAYVRPSRKGT